MILNKKIKIGILLAIVLVLFAVFIAILWPETLETNKDSKGNNEGEVLSSTRGIAMLELFLNNNGSGENNQRPLVFKDGKIIDDILSMIESSQPLTDEAKLDKMSGMARKNNKLITTGNDGSKKEYIFTYDSLYEIGYLEADGKKLEPDYSFYRYMEDLVEYRKPQTNLDKLAVELFEKYSWTVDYRVNTVKETLPDQLKHKAGEYPTKIYWAYNNELSKQIGLDITAYLGKEVSIDIYRLREALPDFLEPRRNARGIILKYDNEIVGAYIDAGRHDVFACSLDRKSIEEITGKDWDGWVSSFIDYEDPLEVKLSQMEPEDVVKEYFRALNDHDTKMIRALMSRSHLCQELSSNLNNRELYNKEKSKDYNIKSVKLLKISKMEGMENGPGTLEFAVEADFDFKKVITADDGIWPRFVIVRKESEKSGWRIEGVGTGP